MSTDKLFLDANILFSAAYGSYGLESLWELAGKGYCELIASAHVIEGAKRNLTQQEHLNRLDSCLSEVRVVPEADPGIPCPINLPDKDRPVLMAAISANADYLLSGDVAHFGKFFGQTVTGVKICRVRDYILTKIA